MAHESPPHPDQSKTETAPEAESVSHQPSPIRFVLLGVGGVAVLMSWVDLRAAFVTTSFSGIETDLGQLYFVLLAVIGVLDLVEPDKYRRPTWLFGGGLLLLVMGIQLVFLQSVFEEVHADAASSGLEGAVSVSYGIGVYVALLAALGITYIGYTMSASRPTGAGQHDSDDTVRSSKPNPDLEKGRATEAIESIRNRATSPNPPTSNPDMEHGRASEAFSEFRDRVLSRVRTAIDESEFQNTLGTFTTPNDSPDDEHPGGNGTVHWHPPRHTHERPIATVDPQDTVGRWIAELSADGIAEVIERQPEPEYTPPGESPSERAQPVAADDPIPSAVASLLRDEPTPRGRVQAIRNPIDDADGEETRGGERADGSE